MPSRRRGGRPTLSHGLDREVYQVVRKIIDERSQYGEPPERLTFAHIYDQIRSSNSSLNRKPKQLLQGSIERVLESLQDEEEDSDTIFAGDLPGADSEPAQPRANGMNRSITSVWAASTQRSTTPQKEQETLDKVTEADAVPKRRLTNGEPLQKKRKAASAIDKSPPTHVSLEDMGGVEHVVEQFQELLLLPLTAPEICTRFKLKPPRGILIHGPPGCGKTMMANAIAAAFDVSFISISAPSIVSGMSGESEKALRDHFEEAKKAAPCLMFIDEIDAITPKRETAQREMERRIVAQLLTCMDDIALEKTDGKPVVVLAATNRPDNLDPALRRAGRFDREINMGVPSERTREKILRALTREQILAGEVDFTYLARHTPGFVGADLSDLVNTAASAASSRYVAWLKHEATKDESEDLPVTSAMEVDGESGGMSVLPAEIQDPNKASDSTFYQQFLRTIQYSKSMVHTNDSSNLSSTLAITPEDFLTALPKIQPSALREGFATIPTETFASVGALHTHISTLQSTIITPILEPTLYTSLGITPSSGTLLYGPPGCGKTLLAKAVANSSHANFISVKGPELLNKYVGESERAVRQVFTRARSSVPVIIFFDELDALVPRRDGANMSEASSRVVNTLLTELDGVGNGREGIYVMAATNRPDVIDAAMLRPGRLDTMLYVGLPDEEGRIDILRTLCKRIKDIGFVFDDRMEALARDCDGFSGADLESLMKKSADICVRRVTQDRSKGAHLRVEDFLEARKIVTRSVSVAAVKEYQRMEKGWRAA